MRFHVVAAALLPGGAWQSLSGFAVCRHCRGIRQSGAGARRAGGAALSPALAGKQLCAPAGGIHCLSQRHLPPADRVDGAEAGSAAPDTVDQAPAGIHRAEREPDCQPAGLFRAGAFHSLLQVLYRADTEPTAQG